MKSKLSFMQRVLTIAGLASLVIAQAGWGVNRVWTPTAPGGTSPDPKSGDALTLRLQYADPNVKGAAITSDILINVAAWDPTKETWVQAQNRKADAIATAINGANLNGVTATLSPNFSWQYNFITRTWVQVPAAQSVTIGGLVKDPKNPNHDVWLKVKDPTKEGNGIGGNLPQKGGGGGSYSPSMGGPRSGMSTGVDPMGNPSLFSFGFYKANGSAADFATIVGQSGWNDSQILSTLASQFNSLYSSSGLTAYYNPTTDMLGFNQSLSNSLVFWEADSDTGIDFSAGVDAGSAPEPATLLMLGSGIVGVGCLLRRRLLIGSLG